jgi:hypothetical protein
VRGSWLMCVRRCPTLPHPHECSTIGAVGLSFRVRNGTGRFPHAMTAVTLPPGPTPLCVGVVGNRCYRCNVFSFFGSLVNHSTVPSR